MKRSGLKRKTDLSRKPSAALARTAPITRGSVSLKRQEGLQRVAPKRKASIPPITRQLAKARSGGRCIVCGRSEAELLDVGAVEWRLHLHHAFDEALFPELAVVEANLVLACGVCHGRHTSAFQRIPLSKLPQCALDLAVGHGPRLNFLARTYAQA